MQEFVGHPTKQSLTQGQMTIPANASISAFAEPRLIEHLRQREADALIVSGSETDVCVLATVLDAVDIGYRVIVVCDAI